MGYNELGLFCYAIKEGSILKVDGGGPQDCGANMKGLLLDESQIL